MSAREEAGEATFDDLPLRERIPEYLAVFGIGLAGALVFAILLTFFGPTFRGSFTNILVVYTVLLFLAGGTTGGGYLNLGVGSIAGLSRRGREAETLDERLQKGLRPERNPRAFWQVVGGVAYLAIAITVMVV